MCSPCRLSSGCSGLLPHPKDVWIRSTGYSKLAVGVSVSVNGCSSFCVSPQSIANLSRMYSTSREWMADGRMDPLILIHFDFAGSMYDRNAYIGVSRC